MWPSSHTFQRHICAVLLLVGCITTYVSLRNKNSRYLKEFQSNNSNVSYPELFDAENISIIVPKFVAKEIKNFKGYRNNYFDPSKVKDRKEKDVKDIYILGLFELSTKWGKRREGFGEMAAAQLAVKHVNDLHVLPGYTLKLITNDTECDPGVGVDRFFHALYSNKVILMLLGAGCSNVTESLANIVPYWNILQISFGSTSPVLSDRNKFPLFFRTVAPDSSHNSARISFIKYFGWDTVATLSLSQQSYLLSLNHFVNELEAANVSCVATITFSLDNFKEQLRILKELDTRIIIGSFSAKIAPKIFCEVYKLKMYGKDYIWILQDQDTLWWQTTDECYPHLLREAVEGLILVSDYNILTNNVTSISGLTNERFENELKVLNVTISKYAPQTYDAVWAMALTLRKTMACKHYGFLERFSHKDPWILKQFMAEMDLLRFTGISGPVKFNGADRVGNSAFKQVQDGNLRNIAIYYAENNFLDFHCQGCWKIKWQDGEIPIAQRILKYRLVTIPRLAFFFVSSFSGIGIAASLVFLYFNLHFRRLRTVKLSSPRLNNIVVLGCILVYVAVILLGLDQATIFFDEKFSQLCTVRIYLLSAGFSLTFGSTFAKTYRVHRIFTYSSTSLVKDKLLKDKQLIGLIFVLLLIDALIILLWIGIDPMERKLRDLPIEISLEHRGIVYQPQVEVCRSKNTTGWFIAIYSYKGFLLIVGLYMAWETRRVKIPSLNDSQYIGICVYSVVSSAIIVVLSNFLENYTTLSYLAMALSILISTTITLVLLFLPKLRTVLGRRRIDDEDAIVQSMGLKIECNTRRFMFDDHRELLYRLEVQNRVYKSELQALDKEIAHLEELLAGSSVTSSKSELFTITNGIVYLPLPVSPSGRASWPSIINNTTNTNFCSENKLYDKVTNERSAEKLKIFERLSKFFGSIPSVWLLGTFGDFAKEKSVKSNPEMSTNLSVSNLEIIKPKLAVSALNINGNNKRTPFIVNLGERLRGGGSCFDVQ